MPAGLRRVAARWRGLDVTVQDLPLGLLFLVLSLLPAFQRHGTQLGYVPDRSLDAGGVAVIALECLPLALRRRRPAGCLALVLAGFAADQLLGYHTAAGPALLVALLSAGCHLQRYRTTVPLLATAYFVGLALALDAKGAGEPLSEYVTFYLTVGVAWVAGGWLRAGRIAEAERRRRVAEDTRTTERTRIARELHDVVTHHVTAMVVQAEAARYMTGSPERLEQTLTAVSDTGRRAITDLRHLLDLLNPDHRGGESREPAVGGLAALVEQTRRAGQPVEFTQEGTAPETAGSADLVAYRVVQEALTNALKYAHGSRTSVRVRHGAREIEVEVATDGSGRDRSPGGSGRGLAGLRERVAVLGGEFDAGPQAGGDFLVRARIPAHDEQRSGRSSLSLPRTVGESGGSS
ncbi:two-component sensor histidine kinase [Streptomyces sp. WAC00469]|uniref:histidine kinase n=2 Tax=Streptomyces TaxID=1883 RepID=A0ABX0YXY7_STRTL|nr:two-component sensor histidine kinase [Streptomyces thermoviolaceus subsp. thermoviolaceus]RSR97841.1 two-component sensor histidine kinase [Streptomyces sp. WAC00469]